MLNKKIKILTLTTLAAASLTGCSKKQEVEENKAPEVSELKAEEPAPTITHVEDISFKDLNSLKQFQKTSTSNFAKFLNTNNIETVTAEDGSLTINKKMTYEKYTKNFNQLAYTHISNDYKNGVGYLKTGIKLNFHLEEKISTENNFVKAVFTIVNTHNPNITEDAFNKQLLSATSDASNTSDSNFDLGIEGMTLNINTLSESNERALVFTVRQKLEFPTQKQGLKEYKTVKEFKEDSAKITNEITNNINVLDTSIKNENAGKAKNTSIALKNIEFNDTTAFSQSLDVELNIEKSNSIPTKAIEGIYKNLNLLLGNNTLKEVSENDLKAYFKSLEVYNGLHTTGTPIDEEGNILEPNQLPISSEILSISATLETYKDENISNNNNVTSNENNSDNDILNDENSIKFYNYKFNIKANIPIKAEGITSL